MALYTVPGLPVSFDAPDGLNEEQVNTLRQDASQRYMRETEEAAPKRPNGWISAAANLLSGGGFAGMPGMGGGAPTPSMSKINPKDFIGMTAEQSNATLGRIHQNDNDALRAHLAQKAQVQQGIEREKDRSQQIKLETQRFKNDMAMQQHQEAIAQEAERRKAKADEAKANADSQRNIAEAKAKDELPTAVTHRKLMDAQAERALRPSPGRAGASPRLQDVNGVPSWVDPQSGVITPANVPPDSKAMRGFVDAQFKDIDAAARQQGLIKKDPFKNDSVPDKAKYDAFVTDYVHGILSSPNTTDDEWATLMHSPKMKSIGIAVTEDDAGIHVKYPDGRSATFTNEEPFGKWDEAPAADSGEPGQLVDVGFWNGMQVKMDPKTGEYYSIGLK